ncbi:MAG: electron transfer flavoprotein subunit alpha/FixB family protein, partial [Gammaproteobacteria bacterium]|nr:electron transfer flavoprotein subunit alpha/FixB family protein [Gammaproteobacteria bacterium]
MTDSSRRPRRNPHNEQSNRRSRSQQGEVNHSVVTSGLQRVRRDPRAQSTRREGSRGRVRIRRGGIATSPDRSASIVTPPVQHHELALKQIPDPAYFVAAVPDLPEGRLTPHDRDLFGAARSLADPGGGA